MTPADYRLLERARKEDERADRQHRKRHLAWLRRFEQRCIAMGHFGTATLAREAADFPCVSAARKEVA